MPNRRVGGIIAFKVNGQIFQAKGPFTYNIGVPKKEAVIGADGIHGFKEVPIVPFIEGTVTDDDETDLQALRETRDATVVLELANGKVISVFEAFEASDGDGSSEEGELQVRFEGIRGQET
jgi:hypothetical protein